MPIFTADGFGFAVEQLELRIQFLKTAHIIYLKFKVNGCMMTREKRLILITEKGKNGGPQAVLIALPFVCLHVGAR